jgi:hypothetical protein
MPLSAQAMQDEIFRKMTPDQKIKLWMDLWNFAKTLAVDKNWYGNHQPRTSPDRRIKDSR